jgi:uncharacterized OsmC-like protein
MKGQRRQQFRHLVRLLSWNTAGQIIFITKRTEMELPGARRVTYLPTRIPNPGTHHYGQLYENCILHGQQALREYIKLAREGFRPTSFEPDRQRRGLANLPLPGLRKPASSASCQGERHAEGNAMNADQLRALQAPLKQRYRDTPAAARIPARAEARLDAEGIACTVPSWHGDTIAGLHAAAGGSGELACSADLLLEAVVACAGVTLRAVATAMGIPLRGGRIVAQGVWDARGTLGIDRSVPVGLTDITLRFELDAEAEPDRLARLIDTTERYCVILQTLRHPPAIAVERA